MSNEEKIKYWKWLKSAGLQVSPKVVLDHMEYPCGER